MPILSKPPRRLSGVCVLAAAAAAAVLGTGSLMASTLSSTVREAIATHAAAVVASANTFMATLSSTQLGSLQSACTMSTGAGTLSYEYVVGLVTCWSNLPGSRNGLKIGDLSTDQQTAVLDLAATALSTRGATTMAEIRAADDVIDATTTNSPWGSTKYFVSFYGTPSTSAPWMLQLSGHHLALNLTYKGTYPASATPMFLGTEPPNWTDSSGTSHAPLETQRSAIYNLAEAIQADSTAASAAQFSTTFTDVVMGIDATTGCDSNYPPTYPTGTTGRGVAVSSLSTAQQKLVKKAILAWTNMLPEAQATALTKSYMANWALAQTYVGYGVDTAGRADFPSNPSGLTSQYSYLRIDGPRVWIEFVVQQGVAYPTQVHYHSLWRDKKADYGGDFSTGSPATTGLCGATTSTSTGGGDSGTVPGAPPA